LSCLLRAAAAAAAAAAASKIVFSGKRPKHVHPKQAMLSAAVQQQGSSSARTAAVQGAVMRVNGLSQSISAPRAHGRCQAHHFATHAEGCLCGGVCPPDHQCPHTDETTSQELTNERQMIACKTAVKTARARCLCSRLIA
jgi:hypothetical protein